MPQKKGGKKKKDKSLAELREKVIKKRLKSGILSNPHKPVSKQDMPFLVVGKLY